MSADLCCGLLQENDMLQKQNELLRSSEAAYQREAQLVSGLQAVKTEPVHNPPTQLVFHSSMPAHTAS
jgi:hypothetical protein